MHVFRDINLNVSGIKRNSFNQNVGESQSSDSTTILILP